MVEGLQERVDLWLQVALAGVEVLYAVVGTLRLPIELYGFVVSATRKGQCQQGGTCKKASDTGVPDALTMKKIIHYYLLTMILRVVRLPSAPLTRRV